MGLIPAKNRVIQAAVAAIALVAVPAYPNSTMRAPASQADQEARARGEGNAMAQADAFTTAGEQAAFLGAYQMYFGPYGKITDEREREKLIRETASAIDDCINGRECGAGKQEKVLKALMQYNMGQDVKRMMLTNNTNKEAMRSIDNSTDPAARAKGQGILNQEQIERALGRGRDVSVDKSDAVKPSQSAKATNLNRSSGSTKDPYYQLDESEVTHKIDDTYLREREILGDKFLKDYAAFLDDFGNTDQRHESRFYRYIPAKADSKVYVYDRRRQGKDIAVPVDEDRYRVAQTEQQNAKVREMLANYKQNLKPIQGYRGEDGKAHITGEGSRPQDLGFGETADFDPRQFPDINFSDLMENGQIKPGLRSRAIARVVNKQFERTAAEASRQGGNSRGIASANGSNPNWIHNITLSPETFDQFLDEIWPSGAKRQTILSSAPPAESPRATGRVPAADRREARPAERRPRPANSRYYQSDDGDDTGTSQ